MSDYETVYLDQMILVWSGNLVSVSSPCHPVTHADMSRYMTMCELKIKDSCVQLLRK